MMGKKKPNDDVVSAASSTFNALFGGIRDENDVVFSVFSDNNPFKRKQQESQSTVNGNISNPKNLDSLGTDISGLKRRKKDDVEEEATSSFEPNGSSENEIKIEPGSYFDSKSEFYEQKQNPNLDIEGEKGREKKKTKKRKRDDVEKEYEEKKYGAIAEGGGKKVVVGEKRKKEDNETEDMFIHTKEEEGFDDEGKLLRTVFVGNLPLKVKKKALIKEFSKFGEIDSVRIRSVPISDAKIPRKGAILQKQINDNADSVHAYIVFKSEQSAEAALVHNIAVVGGNHIRVDRACPPRKKLKGEDAPPLYDNKRTVFVGNLPFDVKDEDIYQLFCGLKDLESSVEAVQVIRHPHMRVGKGIAYVLFKTREAADMVVRRCNLKLRDRELRLSHAQQNSTPSKRKDVPVVVNFPAKKLALDSRTPDTGNMFNSKAAMSYQGLRASKSGAQKKPHPGSSGQVKMKKSRTQQGEKLKVRLEERPAVALRKEREKVLKDASASKKQTGSKRKLDSRTPDVSQRKKAKAYESKDDMDVILKYASALC